MMAALIQTAASYTTRWDTTGLRRATLGDVERVAVGLGDCSPSPADRL